MLFEGPIPFEKRDGYTDLVVSGLVARAEGTAAADASQTAALEIAAGQWAVRDGRGPRRACYPDNRGADA